MKAGYVALLALGFAGTALIGGPIVGRLADLAGGRAPIILGGVVCLVAAMAARVVLARTAAARG